MVEIATEIAKVRAEKRLTQAELARRLKITAAHLSKLERGRSLPSFPLALRIESVLGIPLDYWRGVIGDAA